MSYANGLNGVGIAIPNPDVNLHPLNIDLESIFNPTGWTPTPFIPPSNGGGFINPFTQQPTSNSTPLNPSTALAAAKSMSWEVVVGIGALAWLFTRKKR